MSFDTDKDLFQQEHFTVIEVDLPWIITCTKIGEDPAYNTPPTCKETWDGVTVKTYYFATDNVPLDYGAPASSAGLPADVIQIYDPIHPNIMGLSEQSSELRPGEGLAIQGSLRVTLQDFKADPGPGPGDVDTDGTTEFGTYMGKLNARNILQNKAIRIKYFHKHKFFESNRGIYAESDAETHHFIIEDLKNNGNGTWTLSAKDELARMDKNTSQFPPPLGDELRADIGNGTNDRTLEVDGTDVFWNAYTTPFVVKVGEEFMAVDSVSGPSGGVELSVRVRGDTISVDGQFITNTVTDTHDAGDWAQVCVINQYGSGGQGSATDTTNIARFLRGVLILRRPSRIWPCSLSLWRYLVHQSRIG